MRIVRTVALVLAAALVASTAGQAHAQSLAACGDIHIEATASCEMRTGLSCEQSCEPLSVRAACAAELTAACEGMCDADFDVGCQAQCQGSCTATCQVDPGKFDCSAACQARCDGSCEAECGGMNDGGRCMASCQGTCAASCDADCDIEAPSADCNAQCQASCEGSCRAEANIDCQIDCQASGYAACEVDVQGGCEIDCRKEEGALFCDGQYVDHGDNLAMCVDAIEAWINTNVEGYAEGSAMCANGECVASGSAGVSCSVVPASEPGSGRLAWALPGLVGLAWLRRRRAR